MNFCNWFLERCAPSIGYSQGISVKILERTLENGWVNPEMGFFYYAWSDAIDLTPELTPVEKSLLLVARDNVCVVGDNDSHYLLRMFYFLEKLFERKEQISLIPVDTPNRLFKSGANLPPVDSNEWNLIHRVMKACILPMLGMAALAKMKKKKRYKTAEAEVMRECFEWVISMDKTMRAKGLDHIRAAYETIRDVACVLTEENPNIRKFVRHFFTQLVSHEKSYRIALHRARPYWNWEAEYHKLKQIEQQIQQGRPVEPDNLAIIQDPLRYRQEAVEELERLKNAK